MAFNKDSKILFPFYILMLGSMVIYLGWLDKKEVSLVQYCYQNIGLGLFWGLTGSYASYRLNRVYQRSFRQLLTREKKSVIIAAIIAALGIFMVIWSFIKLLAIQ